MNAWYQKKNIWLRTKIR